MSSPPDSECHPSPPLLTHKWQMAGLSCCACTAPGLYFTRSRENKHESHATNPLFPFSSSSRTSCVVQCAQQQLPRYTRMNSLGRLTSDTHILMPCCSVPLMSHVGVLVTFFQAGSGLSLPSSALLACALMSSFDHAELLQGPSTLTSADLHVLLWGS